MTQLEALNNAAKSTNIEGISVHQKVYDDKRKTTNRYFLQLGNTTISPSLDYENMNHFILGFKKGLNYYFTTIPTR